MEKSVHELNQDELEELRGNYSYNYKIRIQMF
jgi:hypothetical protein